MLLSKARYFEHELLMVKASSFTNKSGQRSFIFWFLGAGWLRILFDSKGFVFRGTDFHVSGEITPWDYLTLSLCFLILYLILEVLVIELLLFLGGSCKES